jgi:hypothetical protein
VSSRKVKCLAAVGATILIAALVGTMLDLRPNECTQKLNGDCIRMEIAGVHR